MKFKNPDIEIIKNKKLYIFDMDGTIYLGGVPFEFAKRFIKNLRSSGKKVLFFTNNASHTSNFYFNKLTRLGFEPREDEIMTSGDVTREFLLAYRKEKSVYMVATDELVEEYKNKRVEVVNGGAGCLCFSVCFTSATVNSPSLILFSISAACVPFSIFILPFLSP